jgi:hypothetical protein
MIWKTSKVKPTKGMEGGIIPGSCKIVRSKNYISVAMPDGQLIPHQLELNIKSNLNEVATATVKMFISID